MPGQVSERLNPGSANSGEFADGAEQLFSWAASIRGALTVGDVLALNPALPDLPPSQMQLWRFLASLPIQGQAPAGPVLAIQLARLLDSVDLVHLAIYLRRINPIDPPTLQSIAEESGKTRERIRQIQRKVEADLLATLQDPESARMRWMFEEIGLRLGSHFPISEMDTIPQVEAIKQSLMLAPAFSGDSEHASAAGFCHEVALGLCLRLSGGYQVSGNWASRGPDSAAAIGKSLLDFVRERRIIGLAQAVRILGDRGFCEPAALFFVRTARQIRTMDGLVFWWQGDIAMEAAATLRRLGRPATAPELLGLLEGSRTIRTLRNALYKDPDITRVSKTEFALTEWGHHEYGGISDEIASFIHSHGGDAVLAEMVSDIAARFKVAEGSVMSYAFAPRFVIESGRVRIRKPSEPFTIESPQPLREAGVFAHSEDEWTYAVLVNQDTLRGSGRILSTHLAWELGVRPDSGIVFEFGNGLEAGITWPMQSFTAHIGSLREIAASLGAKENDRLLLRFNISAKTGAATLIRASDEPDRILTTLSGGDTNDVLERVAALVRSPKELVAQRLTDRGDSWVADALDSGRYLDQLGH